MKRFRRGLIFKAHRLLHHSTLGSKTMKKKKVADPRWSEQERSNARTFARADWMAFTAVAPSLKPRAERYKSYV